MTCKMFKTAACVVFLCTTSLRVEAADVQEAWVEAADVLEVQMEAAKVLEAQMERIGALDGKLMLKLQQTLPKLIRNEDGEGGVPNQGSIAQLYDKALSGPKKVLAEENAKPQEQRDQMVLDAANSSIKITNERWTQFQRDWAEINQQMGECNHILSQLDQVLVNGVHNNMSQWIASGVHLSIVITILDALDQRADEIKAKAEAGHLSLWKATVGAWNELAK